MTVRTIIGASLGALSLALPAAGLAATQFTMGDGAVRGAKIDPYEFTWVQCSLQEGEWVAAPALTESAVVIGDHILRLRQKTQSPDGRKSSATTYFERASLSPLRMEQEVFTPDGARAASITRELSETGYSASTLRDGESSTKTGAVSSKLFHGGALGVPLATLDYDDAPFVFGGSMIGFDATYEIKASLAGRKKIKFGGAKIEILLVDVEWRHNEIGDIYPPGPDASGGQYWIVQNPPVGFPYVPRYKTDTYAIEFMPETCPASPPDGE